MDNRTVQRSAFTLSEAEGFSVQRSHTHNAQRSMARPAAQAAMAAAKGGLATLNAILLAFIDLRNPEPLRQAAQALRSEMPGSQIICVNTPATKVIEEQIAEIDRWITYRGGAASALDLIDELRRLRPAAVCILYRSRKPKAHLKLEILAALIGGRRLYGAFHAAHTSQVKTCRAGVPLALSSVEGAPAGNETAGVGTPALQTLMLQAMSRFGLWLRVAGKTLVMLARSAAAGVLAAFAGAVLGLAGLLAQPGERLGKPAAGQPR